MATNFKLDDYSNQLDTIQRMKNNIDELDGMTRRKDFYKNLKRINRKLKYMWVVNLSLSVILLGLVIASIILILNLINSNQNNESSSQNSYFIPVIIGSITFIVFIIYIFTTHKSYLLVKDLKFLYYISDDKEWQFENIRWWKYIVFYSFLAFFFSLALLFFIIALLGYISTKKLLDEIKGVKTNQRDISLDQSKELINQENLENDLSNE